MIETIKKYWAIGLILSGLIGGLISTYALPSVVTVISFWIDIKKVQAEQDEQKQDIKYLKEVVIRTDERYKHIEQSLIELKNAKQERLAEKR